VSDTELLLVYKSAGIPKVDETDAGGMSGYASTFHFLDYHNDIIAPGAYKSDIGRFLQKGFIGGVGHDHRNPIGKPVELFEDIKGLYLVAQFVNTTKAQEDRKLITNGVVKELSVGILPLQSKALRTKKAVQEYWSSVGYSPSEEELLRAENGARLIKRAKLLEVSPVALAANEQSEIVAYKAGKRFSQASVEMLTQICAQVKIAYELLETLLEEAGVKGEDEVAEEVVSEATKPGTESQKEDLLQAFREFLNSGR
jgi:HK97 family phage prohead protease